MRIFRCIMYKCENTKQVTQNKRLYKLDSIVHWQWLCLNFQTFFHYLSSNLDKYPNWWDNFEKTKLASQTNCLKRFTDHCTSFGYNIMIFLGCLFVHFLFIFVGFFVQFFVHFLFTICYQLDLFTKSLFFQYCKNSGTFFFEIWITLFRLQAVDHTLANISNFGPFLRMDWPIFSRRIFSFGLDKFFWFSFFGHHLKNKKHIKLFSLG